MLLTFLFIQILNFTTDNYLGHINAKLLSDKVIIISENGVARGQEVLQ